MVQLYVHDRTSSVTRPVKLLRDFARVSLTPGESRQVQFELGRDDLSLLDERMQRVVEPGWFEILVGGSSVDVVMAELEVVAAGRSCAAPACCGRYPSVHQAVQPS